MNAEQHALGRVLLIANEAYSAIAKDELSADITVLLDSLSTVLTHLEDSRQPISKLMKKLGGEIKSKYKEFFPQVRKYFSAIYPINDYDYEKAKRHIPAVIFGNDRICAQYVAGDKSRVKAMCEAMKSYPGFLFGEYEALSDKQFFDLVFGYYPKLYERDDFMGEMKYLFN